MGVLAGIALLAASPVSVPFGQPAVSQATLSKGTEVAAAGKPFLVGITITPEDEWYSYWTNPGDSGMPLTIKWTTPPGWKIGPLHSPVPETKIDATGLSLTYPNSATHLVEITPPAGASGAFKLQASLQWMVCKEACIIQSANLSMDVRVGREAKVQEDKQQRLLEAKRAIPATLTGGTALRKGSDWHLNLPAIPGQPDLAEARFFAMEATVANHVATLKAGTDGWTIPVSPYMTSMPTKLAGLLVLPDGKAYELGLAITKE